MSKNNKEPILLSNLDGKKEMSQKKEFEHLFKKYYKN